MDELDSREVPTSFVQAHRNFRDVILNETRPFPCYFAAVAERAGSLVYSFLLGSELDEAAPIGSALDAFFSTAKTLPPLPVLVIFAMRENHTQRLSEDEDIFWRLTNFINRTRVDVEPSDDNDITSPKWLLKFGQTPIFITGHSPHYKRRLSRWSPDCLTLVVQAKSNLARVASNPCRLNEIVDRIRTSIDMYDALPRSPLLGVYGQDDVADWEQFWLPDTNDISAGTCRINGY